MSKILVAVGGTGKETLLAYLHVCLLGDIPAERAFVFDSDITNPDNSVGKELEVFKESNRGLGIDVDYTEFHAAPQKLVLKKKKFAETFETKSYDKRILDSFFKENQQRIPITTGFYGQPMVGSVCMQQRLGELHEDGKLDQLLGVLSADAQTTSVIVGSNFGGTGAGGAPIIGEWIYRQYLKKRLVDQNLYHLFISHYKWFRLQTDGEKKITDTNLTRNAHSGLKYYGDKLLRYFDKIVMLGLPKECTRIGENEDQQPHSADMLYLLGALLANSVFQSVFGKLKQAGHDETLSKFVFHDPIEIAHLRMVGPVDERNSFWRVKPELKDSLAGSLTIGYFLAHLCYWLSGYIKSPYWHDTVWTDNHFPKEFDAILRKLGKPRLEGLARKMGTLGKNLRNSVEWVHKFGRDANHLDFTTVPKGVVLDSWQENMGSISWEIEPVFRRVYGLNFQKFLFSTLSDPFDSGQKGKEQEFSVEIYKRLRRALYDRLK
jgi:hypothetical protein